MRAICEEEVRRPGSLRPELAGDLDHILRMALRKEPQRRYSSADQLAADLRRWLADEPVLASPDTIWYRSGKFIRRHWLGVAAAAIVLLALVSGAAVAAWQARRAERRFADVRRLASVFLFDFEQSIHTLPGATKARQLLVKTALEYLRSLSREAAGDPVLTRELASAYEKVGDIQGDDATGNVDDASGAMRSYREGIALLEPLLPSNTGDPGLRSNLAQVLVKLAGVQVKTRQLKAAIESCRQAASIDQAVLQTHPADRSATGSLAEAYALLAFLNGRDAHAAMDYAQRGLALRESLAAQAPQDRRVQRSLADGYLSVGNLCEMLQRSPAESIGYYEKALPIFERLAVQDPADADGRRMLMVALGELGEMQLLAAPNPRVAGQAPLANLQSAYAMANSAVTADPANARAVTDLTAMCARLGNSLGVLGRRAEGERVMERAVQAASDLAQRGQASGEDRLDLGKVHGLFADFLAKNGRTPDAIRHRRIAAEIYAKMAAANPADSKVRLLQVWTWSSLGDLLAKQGDWAGARSAYALGREVAEKLAPGSPAFADALAAIQRADLHAAQVLGR
jgi:tetratricopeptide (TPR) repeat protein